MTARNKFINIRDLVVFAALAVFVTVFTVLASVNKINWQHPAGMGILIAATVGFWFVFAGVLAKNLVFRPAFVLEGLNIAVWTVKGSPAQMQMAKAISHFATFMAHELVMRGYPDHYTANKLVNTALENVGVEWRAGAITENWGGWMMINKAGIQSDKFVLVEWKGSIKQSALFHELLHVIDQYVRGDYDPEHKDQSWWVLDDRLTQEFRE